MTSYIRVSGEWPDPRKDTVVYVVNPIEADLPGHWVPMSVLKKHLELKLNDRPTTAPRKKIKITKKLKLKLAAQVTDATNHHENFATESNKEEKSEKGQDGSKATTIVAHTLSNKKSTRDVATLTAMNVKASSTIDKERHSQSTARHTTKAQEIKLHSEALNPKTTHGTTARLISGPTIVTTLSPLPGVTSSSISGPNRVPSSGVTSAPTPRSTFAPTLVPTSGLTITQTDESSPAPISGPLLVPTTELTIAPTADLTSVPISRPSLVPLSTFTLASTRKSTFGPISGPTSVITSTPSPGPSSMSTLVPTPTTSASSIAVTSATTVKPSYPPTPTAPPTILTTTVSTTPESTGDPFY